MGFLLGVLCVFSSIKSSHTTQEISKGISYFASTAASDDLDVDNDTESQLNVKTGSNSSLQTKSGSRKKRHRVAEAMEDNALMGIVEAAKEIAKALMPQKCNHIERALKQLPNMSDDLVYDGMGLLGPDPQLTEVFFGYSEDSS